MLYQRRGRRNDVFVGTVAISMERLGRVKYCFTPVFLCAVGCCALEFVVEFVEGVRGSEV